jgi:hypothetical protein
MRRIFLVGTTIIIFWLSACTHENPPFPNAPLPPNPYPLSPTNTPFQPIPWTLTPSMTPTASPTIGPSATPSPTPAPYSIWVDPALPPGVLNSLYLPAELGLKTDQAAGSDWQLRVGTENPVSEWVYVLVAPFPTLTDGVTGEQLLRAWQGKTGAGDLEGQPLLMAESTLEVLSILWGEPATNAVKSIAVAGIDDPGIGDPGYSNPGYMAIIPFEELTPQWKVMAIDGISPIHKDFAMDDYELVVPISLEGAAPVMPIIPASNRDPGKLTILAMTGVTALVRATAFAMEQRGVTYPAQDIGELLRSADITHISNEVPFAEDCPYPNPVQEDMHFCSAEKYIGLLEEVGTDVVELTGDHFADWGAEAMLFTLELYDERGWVYYGGGENLQKGRKAVIIEHNGNKLGLIGCNAKGGGYAQASESNPGAVACDWEWMTAQIEAMRAQGILPIATFQHFEYYTYSAQANQIRDAERMTEAGAVIISGSQAHQPQAFEFSNGGFVHHGLGNLFFDQLDVSEETRQGFIDLHVFYEGRHISTELVTIIFVDYARPRLMTAEERVQLLQAVFAASGW